jgi:CheY-like chemotaxis protein
MASEETDQDLILGETFIYDDPERGNLQINLRNVGTKVQWKQFSSPATILIFENSNRYCIFYNASNESTEVKTIYMKITPPTNYRILVIDDNSAIHEDIRKILIPSSGLRNDLDEDEAALFEGTTVKFRLPVFEIDSAYQGQEGLAMVEKSLLEDRPYSLAFVDGRMPPGWEGVRTIGRIWEKYPDLQVVMCTAFSDYSGEEILRILGYSDRMVMLKKPFDKIEVLLLAIAMTEKGRLSRESKLRVEDLKMTLEERNLTLKGILRRNEGYSASNV